MAAGRLYTQDELEQVFRHRQRDQEELLTRAAAKAVDALRPEFDKVNGRIDALTDQVSRTNGQVSKHGSYFHNLGVDEMSLDEQRALPELVDDHLRLKENRKDHDRVERRRVVRDQAITTFISTAAGIIVAGGALVGILRAAGVIP